ncbi:MAG: ATP-binding protein [Xenococcaceae cyanobacterium]
MIELSSFNQSSDLDLVQKQEYFASKMQYLAAPHQLGQQIIQVILTSPDSQTMLSRIALKLGEMFHADACLIVPGISPTDTVQTGFWRAGDFPVLSPETKAQLLSHPVLADVLAGAEPLAISDLQTTQNKSTFDWPWEVLPVRAVLRIATRFQGTANGMIVVGHSQAHKWTSSEKELLKIASEGVAIALSQAKLQQQAQTSAGYQTLLNDLSEGIRHSSDIDSILNLALAGTAKALKVDRGLILMLKYDEPQFGTRCCQSLLEGKAEVACQWSADIDSPESLTKYSFRLSDSPLCQKALKNTPQSLAIAEGANFPDLTNLNLPAIFNSEATSALLMMPLMGSMTSDSKPAVVLGFLVLQHPQPRLWQADELKLVHWVSTQASTAILHEQQVNQVQSLVDERTAQLKWSLEIQAKLSEKMRQQIQELQHLNELKNEFIANLSHALKHPLTKMKMAIEMLKITLVSNQCQRHLEILESECDKEINLVNDLLTLKDLESKKFKPHPKKLDLQYIISELAQSFEQEWTDKGLTLVVDYHRMPSSETSPKSSLVLYTDPESLKGILVELLTNAGKFSAPETTVYLSITQQVSQEKNRIVLTLTNIGSGISPEEQKYIFEPFRRGQGVTEKAIPGTGLGLALVKSLVEHLNGTIDVSSHPSENPSTFVTSFTLTLTQFQ